MIYKFNVDSHKETPLLNIRYDVTVTGNWDNYSVDLSLSDPASVGFFERLDSTDKDLWRERAFYLVERVLDELVKKSRVNHNVWHDVLSNPNPDGTLRL